MTFYERDDSPVPQKSVLRAHTENGEEYDNPSEDLLFMLFGDLQQKRDYFIVDRLTDTPGHTYMQAMRIPTGYLLERRKGSEATHQHAFTTDVRLAHQEMTTWAFSLGRADTLTWSPGYSDYDVRPDS